MKGKGDGETHRLELEAGLEDAVEVLAGQDGGARRPDHHRLLLPPALRLRAAQRRPREEPRAVAGGGHGAGGVGVDRGVADVVEA